jgi:hypothetical protein
MRSGVRPGSRASRIVEAIARGVDTCPALASEFQTEARLIRPELSRLHRMRAIWRAGKVGRLARWRLPT